MNAVRKNRGKAHKAKKNLAGKQILVVDDDPVQIMALSQMLHETGCRVIELNDSRLFPDVLNRHRVDLMILDVMMPVLNGWEVFQKMREMPPYREMPVIFLTVLVKSEEEDQFSQKNDQCRVLAKPVTRDDLLSTIEELLMV